jgi:uracil-DNA glycosylase
LLLSCRLGKLLISANAGRLLNSLSLAPLQNHEGVWRRQSSQHNSTISPGNPYSEISCRLAFNADQTIVNCEQMVPTNQPGLLADIRACTLCQEQLPLGPRPVVQVHPQAKLLIAGQAPSRRVHRSGVPFDDISGQRLRQWLGVSCETFYDAQRIALVPMGFCYPGAGKSGDLPPTSQCAATWRQPLLEQLPQIETTLVLGRYAHAYHLGAAHPSVTAAVQAWRDYWPRLVPLPHPSPRNAHWLRRNPWFEAELLPTLKQHVSQILAL